jgi:hypothetical protein
MSKSASFIIVLLLVIIGLLGWMIFVKPAEAPTVATSTPETVIPADTTPDTIPTALHDRVSVSYPRAGATVPKTFTVIGKAPGNWFFEASAPLMIQAPDGSKIAQGYVQAIGEWMTTELVDFTGDVNISTSYSGPATLVLMRDNPSGLPENDDSIEIAIIVQ